MNDAGEMPGGWKCFHRRLILTINSLFLITMAIFLTTSYFGERSRHFRETFRHLDETLGVLVDQVRDDDSIPHLEVLENQLAERTGVPHRLLILESGGTIAAASDPSLIDRDPAIALEVRKMEPGEPAWSFAGRDQEAWLLSSVSLADAGGRSLLLMRSRPKERVFAKRFLGFHGVHILVTIALFTLLLEIVGSRYIRRPIVELQAHIEQLESGRFGVRTEVGRNDELGWLAQRFTRLAERLQDLMTRRVRAEKYASAYASAWKSVQQMMDPLHSLDRDLLYLEGLAEQDRGIRTVVTSLREDHERLIKTVQGLLEVEPPPGVELMDDP